MALDITCTHLFKQHVVSGAPLEGREQGREQPKPRGRISRSSSRFLFLKKQKEVFCFCTLTTCGIELHGSLQLQRPYQRDAGAPSARERGGAGDGRHSRTAGFCLLVLIPSDLCVLGPLAQAHGMDAAVCPKEPRLGQAHVRGRAREPGRRANPLHTVSLRTRSRCLARETNETRSDSAPTARYEGGGKLRSGGRARGGVAVAAWRGSLPGRPAAAGRNAGLL